MTVDVHKKLFPFFSLCLLFLIAVAYAAITGIYFIAIIPFIILMFYAGWLNPGWVFIVLLVSLPFSFEFHLSSSLGTDLPAEPLMWILSFICIGSFIFSPNSWKKTLSHPIIILLVLLLAWTACTVLFSQDKMVSMKFFLAKGWYVGAFVLLPLLVFREERNIDKAAAWLVGAMLVACLAIMYKHATTDFSFATINDAVAPFFRNHVNYGAMLVCIIPVTIGLLHGPGNPKVKNVLRASLVIFLAALYFSYSRGAWIALVAGGIAFWLIKKRLLVFTYLIALVAGIFFLLWLKNEDRYLRYAHDYRTTIFHKDFSQHITSTYKLKDISTAERFYRWIAGVRMVKDHWLTGSGPNTFYPLYKSYTIPAYKTWVSDNRERSTVHNYFLLTLIEQGIPGLMLLVILVGAILYYTEKGFHYATSARRKTIYMVIGIMTTMIIVLNCLSDLIETDKVGSLFFLCLGILVSLHFMSPTSSSQPPFQPHPLPLSFRRGERPLLL